MSCKEKLQKEWLKDTAEVYELQGDIPDRFKYPSRIRGYNAVKEHPLYQTSANTYGATRPTVHDIQRVYHGRVNEFTKMNPGSWEMSKNSSLNTEKNICTKLTTNVKWDS